MTRLKRKKEVAANKDVTAHDVRFGTPELVAEYRAERMGTYETVIEVGAGAGLQTAAFAARATRVIAIDIDTERLGRARFPENVTPIAGDALDPAVLERVKDLAQGPTVVFLDPQRPAQSTHRRLSEIQPPIMEFLDAYGAITPDIAIELPPFLDQKEIPKGAEREYLSVDGQLNRLTCYFGALRRDDVSVVRLPERERVACGGRLPGYREDLNEREARFVLEPDAALAHAGLTPLVLPAHYRKIAAGRKMLFLASKRPASGLLRAYRIVVRGDEGTIRRALARRPPAAVILHGSLSPKDQRDLLAQYKQLCRGKGRVHLFLGRERFLTVRE